MACFVELFDYRCMQLDTSTIDLALALLVYYSLPMRMVCGGVPHHWRGPSHAVARTDWNKSAYGTLTAKVGMAKETGVDIVTTLV